MGIRTMLGIKFLIAAIIMFEKNLTTASPTAMPIAESKATDIINAGQLPRQMTKSALEVTNPLVNSFQILFIHTSFLFAVMI